jgi:hypothetical protein
VLACFRVGVLECRVEQDADPAMLTTKSVTANMGASHLFTFK